MLFLLHSQNTICLGGDVFVAALAVIVDVVAVAVTAAVVVAAVVVGAVAAVADVVVVVAVAHRSSSVTHVRHH